MGFPKLGFFNSGKKSLHIEFPLGVFYFVLSYLGGNFCNKNWFNMVFTVLSLMQSFSLTQESYVFANIYDTVVSLLVSFQGRQNVTTFIAVGSILFPVSSKANRILQIYMCYSIGAVFMWHSLLKPPKF